MRSIAFLAGLLLGLVTLHGLGPSPLPRHFGESPWQGNAPGDLGMPEAHLRAAGLGTDGASLLALTGDATAQPQLRAWAALALGRSSGAAAVKPLVALLQSPEADLRHAAVAGLRQTGSPEAVPALRTVLASPDPGLRSAAVNALGSIGGSRAVQVLSQVVESPRERSGAVRLEAMLSLGRLGDPAGAPALRSVLRASLEGECLASNALSPRCLPRREELRDWPEYPLDRCIPEEIDRAGRRAAAAASLAKLKEGGMEPYLALSALDLCTEEWLRLSVIGALESLTGESFGYSRPYHEPTTRAQRRAGLRAVASWASSFEEAVR